jgi:hypothetical protein
MTTLPSPPRVLVGPRWLENRICRLVYRQETDEVWAEQWSDGSWIRTSALVRHVLKAPPPRPAQMKRLGVPQEVGFLDGDSKAG